MLPPPNCSIKYVCSPAESAYRQRRARSAYRGIFSIDWLRFKRGGDALIEPAPLNFDSLADELRAALARELAILAQTPPRDYDVAHLTGDEKLRRYIELNRFLIEREAWQGNHENGRSPKPH